MKVILFVVALYNINAVNAQQKDIPAAGDTTVQRPKSFIQLCAVKEHESRIRSLIIPAGLITYGFIALENDGLRTLDHSTKFEIKEDHPAFGTRVDNYLQYAPALAVYGLNIMGIKGKNNLRDRTMLYALSSVITSAFVVPIKAVTRIQRPDGYGTNAFPSGHTATAFAAAEFLRMEYKDISPWYGVAGYAVAATTGVLRMYNNRHWLSDVVTGAGFGIVSTKLAYWLYPSIKRKLFKDRPMNTMVMPFYQSRGAGMALIYNFKH